MEQQVKALRGFLTSVKSKETKESAEGSLTGEFLRLKRQSTKFRADKTYPTTVAEKQVNAKKNRYKDIVPFDHSRVKLSLITSDSENDYINASFIKGVFAEQAYIATQGPLPSTVPDFLRMLWEYKVEVVVMACREFEMGKKKCERYWPEKGGLAAFGPFTVLCESEKNRGDYITRALTLSFMNQTRTMQQLHYMNWPDHGVPDSIPPILEMIQEMRCHQPHENIPICIHCSAGCGRTGALCAIDYTWNLLKNEMITNTFSIFQLVQDMRTQRPSVVQTKEQYELVYQTIVFLFEHYLKALDGSTNRQQVPVPSLPIQVENMSDTGDNSEELLGIPEKTMLEKLQVSAENKREMEVVFQLQVDEKQWGLANHTAALADPPAMWRPLVEENAHSACEPEPTGHTPANMLGPVMPPPRRSKEQGQTVCEMQRPEPKPRHLGIRTDLLSPKPRMEEHCPLQEELEPHMMSEAAVNVHTLTSFVEDPYFSSQEPESPMELDEVFPTDSQSTINASFKAPILALNDKILVLPQIGSEGIDATEASVELDSPPPLPKRTPESFILATSVEEISQIAESTEVEQKLDMVSSLDTAEAFSRDGSAPSPVPPLPERTPESFILASNEDLVEKLDLDRLLAVSSASRVGTSLEWAGSSNPDQVKPRNAWTRSKSLKVRMSLPGPPSFPPPPVPAPPKDGASLLLLLPDFPPPSQSDTEISPTLTPHLPERTPESFIMASPDRDVHQDLDLPTSIGHPQRIGTSSEWAGNSQPKRFLDCMLRSKSVRTKSSKQGHLSTIIPEAVSTIPEVEGGSASKKTVAPTESEVSSEVRPNQAPERTPLSSKPRTKSLKFLKNMRKPKENSPAASAPSRESPSHSSSLMVKLGFGHRFGKPKGPRNQPETWV
ncbi:tyrosine-protein phosphatase non-receptor type 22 isoform X2 [Brienomyrus brachyistius]|uniref:tyrosine-protein phosphatase non-receptor type 22 isoform X2 n=1 Tax=Brienomyrus brachyistius TaxID=42636 RepID=UPI0020B1DDB1|nr:tyrosine-protein phosphatase non-receptor type 22 isoform X2 [Brienomyrus brachyistius]